MKKIATMILALILSLSPAASAIGCSGVGSKDAADLVVDASNVQTTVKVGDYININKLKASASLKDGSTKELAISDLAFYNGETKLTGTVFKGLTEKAGSVIITVKYGDLSKYVTFTVEELVAQSLELNSSAVTKAVKVGDPINISPLKATVVYDNGSKKDIETADLEFYQGETKLDKLVFEGLTNTAGDVVITVKYLTLSENITFVVTNLVARTLKLNTSDVPWVKLEDTAEFGSITATVTYDNDSTQGLTVDDLSFYLGETELTLDEYKDVAGISAQAGDITVTAKYKEATADFTVTVKDVEATALNLDESGINTEIYVGKPIDLSKLKATVTFEDESTKAIALRKLEFWNGNNQLTGTIFEGLTAEGGEVVITVKYASLPEEEIVITVDEYKATSFEITSSEEITVKRGDDIDLSGITATATLENAEVKNNLATKNLSFFWGETTESEAQLTLDSNGKVSGKTSATGTFTITVEYRGQTDTLTIIVEEPPIKEFKLNGVADLTVVINQSLSFGGITANVTYDNEKETTEFLTVDKLTFFRNNTQITLDANDKASGWTEVSEVTVTAKYKAATANFTVTVTSVYAFRALELPSSEGTRQTNATTEALFLNAEETAPARMVGDDNAFRFLPELRVKDNIENKAKTLNSYETISTITLNGTELVADQDLENKTTKYYSDNSKATLIVTSYYNEGKYQFASAAVGNTYTISILPKMFADNWDEEDTVSVTVKIVDGFNVYDAKDLAIIDNTSDKSWTRDANDNGGWAKNPDVWADIRTEKGFSIAMSNATKAVILQRNIAITDADLPASYVGTVARDLVYYDFTTLDGDSNPTTMKVQNAKRLTHDSNGNMFLYERISDSDFTFYGNYYTLDGSNLPLVSAFDETAVETDQYGNKLIIANYGSDTSNASLFRFRGATSGRREDNGRATYAFENLNVKGNADTSQWVIYGPDDPGHQKDPLPVNAGGFIFSKTCDCNLTTTNVSMIKCFIGYILEENVTATADYVKVNSSYQDAAFLWGYCNMTITNSSFTEAGGPLFIMQHLTDGHDGLKAQGPQIPTLTIVNSNVENFVTGGEMWFASMGATAILPTLKSGTNAFLEGVSGLVGAPYGVKTATQTNKNRTDCLNLICLSMSNGSDASVLASPEPQGYCSITKDGKTYVLNRMADSPIRTVIDDKGTTLIGSGNGIFNADGTNGVIYEDPSSPVGINYLCNDPDDQAQLDQNAQDAYAAALYAGKTTDEAQMAALNVYLNAAGPAAASIYTGNFISLNKGGMGLILGTSFK